MKKNQDLVARVMSAFIVFAITLGYACVASYSQSPRPSSSPSPAAVNAPQSKDLANRPPDNLPTNPPEPVSTSKEWAYLSSREFVLSVLVSLVGLVTLLLVFFLLKKVPKLKTEDTLRTFGVILIIMGTLFMIAAGFSSEQIAPAMGLFGLIAGYLLGRGDKKGDEK